MNTVATLSATAVVATVRAWAERGWLRRLDAALAAFVVDVCPAADATVVLAAALAAHLEGEGHACLSLDDLLEDPGALLGFGPDASDALRFVMEGLPPDVDGWIAALRASPAVASMDLGAGDETDEGTPFVVAARRFYLRRYWGYERRIVDAVATRAAILLPADGGRVVAILDRLFPHRIDDEKSADWQRVAAALALQGSIVVVTGGPGTGKTWTAARLIAAFLATADDPAEVRVALAAPTGKAAARLGQALDAAFGTFGDALPAAARIDKARTLHSLLGARPDTRRTVYHAAHPLAVDLLVVDEASMIDVEMMDALLAALPSSARLVLLGDKDQLSSVEAGAVLGELCRDARNRYDVATADWLASAARANVTTDASIPTLAHRTVVLQRGERFTGAIDALARAVNEGRVDDATAALAGGDAVAWLVAADPQPVVALALDGRTGAAGFGPYLDALAARPQSLLAEDHDLWARRVLDAFDGFRLLCAVRTGPWGVASTNRAIEAALGLRERLAVGGDWYVGRPVIAAHNDREARVSNGDVGIALPAPDGRLRVHFSDGAAAVRSVGITRLADAETAFAITVHKAQGSEFGHAALVLPADGARVVSRELVYTGVTRARTAFTLVTPSRHGLATALATRTRRSSGIAAMLAEAGAAT